MCKCKSITLGALAIILGILFLLRDLNVWGFWNIQWYTAAFVLAAIGTFWCCCGCCKK